MTAYTLTHKDLLELVFWTAEYAKRDGFKDERAKLPLYMNALGLPRGIPGWGVRDNVSILEIGTGPYLGLLQYLHFADVKGERWTPAEMIAVDPLFNVFAATGMLEDRGAIRLVSTPFEYWPCEENRFDAIITTNAIDHGEMGWYLLPKIWRLLKPGGRLFLHAHLRPPELVNILHDHPLTLDGMLAQLQWTSLEQERRHLYRKDIDDQFCEAVVGVWRKP